MTLSDQDVADTLMQRAHKLAELAGGDTTMHVTTAERNALTRHYQRRKQAFPARGDTAPNPSRITALTTPNGTVSLALKPTALLSLTTDISPHLNSTETRFHIHVQGERVFTVKVNDNDPITPSDVKSALQNTLIYVARTLTPLLKQEED